MSKLINGKANKELYNYRNISYLLVLNIDSIELVCELNPRLFKYLDQHGLETAVVGLLLEVQSMDLLHEFVEGSCLLR